ncbi:LADA_0B01992g1_1 [Lachancea dasiensis]|uniref:LADA_0B01992g1_1 n=1 Tax=Lachancea dasiensis TaxID=1072105 RepID=A0A1G4ISJ0_9SACH|nr:LADA_0B01992g1_1 [Lachancea dasiensis]
MMPQRNYHKSSRALVANGSIMNIEYSPNPSTGKAAYDRSPKKRDSFKIQKAKRLDVSDTHSPLITETSDVSQCFATNYQADGSAVLRSSVYMGRGYPAAGGTMAQYTLMNHKANDSNDKSNNGLDRPSKMTSGLVNRARQESTDNRVDHRFTDFEQFGFQTFPSYFNPRAATNMPHQEKVNKWIENVPVINLGDGNWRSDCFNVDNELDWEEREFDLAYHECMSLSLTTADEVLHLQAKRLDTLVRRIYDLTPEVPLNATGKYTT